MLKRPLEENVRHPRAVWFTRPNRVEIRESEEWEIAPSRGQVKLKTLYSGISAGTEMLALQGRIPKNIPLGIQTDRSTDLPSAGEEGGTFEFPMKYGYCNVGRIVQVGEDSGSAEVGDVAFVFHPHETEYVIDESSCVILPTDIDPKLGVFVANVETAIGIVHDCGIRFGETVAVFGLGVMGLLVVSLLRKAGAGRIVGIDPISNRRKVAEALGADDTAGSEKADLERTLIHFRAMDGLPDHLVDVSGSPSALRSALEFAGRESKIVVGSWYGDKEVNLDLGQRFHRNRNRIVSSQVSNLNPELLGRWTKRRRLELAVEQLRKIPLSHLITDVLPFRDATHAYAKITRDPQNTLQVILDYSGEE